MIQFIEYSLSNHRTVGVSCGAGLGRTGTILACYLVTQGYDADAAINQIRKNRPGSIETQEQEDAIKAYALTIGEWPIIPFEAWATTTIIVYALSIKILILKIKS